MQSLAARSVVWNTKYKRDWHLLDFFPTIMILQSKTLGGLATNYCIRFDDFLSVLVKYVTEHEVQFAGLEPHPHKSSRC